MRSMLLLVALALCLVGAYFVFWVLPGRCILVLTNDSETGLTVHVQAADHDFAPLLAREIDGQSRVTDDRDILQVGYDLARELDPFVQRKEWRLVRIRRDTDDDSVKNAGRAAHQVLVTIGYGIECARIDGNAFRIHLSAR